MTNASAITRRGFVGGVAAVALAPAVRALADEREGGWKIGACDWSIGQRQKIEAFDVAREIGLDGVQFSFDDPGAPWDLRDPAAREAVAQKQRETGVTICSLAMGVLNGKPYATDADAERWVAECVEVMPKANQALVLLAFFGKGDINGDRALQDKVIERLKRVAPTAEKAGVTLGLETWLSVDDHLRILDGVGSDAVSVYYDTANMEKMGYDIYADIRRLKGRICQVHAKENGQLLGKGKVDFAKVRAALDEVGYRDWLVIESAVPPGMGVVPAYRHNAAHLREVFGL